ncbi:rbcL, partial [Symbiodinium necroappetens]
SEAFGADVPPSMLRACPEKVSSIEVISVSEARARACPRCFEGKNCNSRTNCRHMHPDFMNGEADCSGFDFAHGSEAPASILEVAGNQRGDTFDEAMWSAVRLQKQLRGDRAPFAYDAPAGDKIRQISRGYILNGCLRRCCASSSRRRRTPAASWSDSRRSITPRRSDPRGRHQL